MISALFPAGAGARSDVRPFPRLQVVLVALLASLTWGVPFPHGREGAPAAAEALLPDREHVQQDLHGRLEQQQVQNITEDETR